MSIPTTNDVMKILSRGAMCVTDIAKQLGTSVNTARRRVKELVSTGKAQPVSRMKLKNGNIIIAYGLTTEAKVVVHDMTGYPLKVQNAFMNPLCRLVMFEGSRYERP